MANFEIRATDMSGDLIWRVTFHGDTQGAVQYAKQVARVCAKTGSPGTTEIWHGTYGGLVRRWEPQRASL